MTTQNAYIGTFVSDIAEALDATTDIVRVVLLGLTLTEAQEELAAAWEAGTLGGNWDEYECNECNEGLDATFSGVGTEARIIIEVA